MPRAGLEADALLRLQGRTGDWAAMRALVASSGPISPIPSAVTWWESYGIAASTRSPPCPGR